MKISALFLLSGLAGLLGMPLPASATTTVSVGSDGACSYDSISRAVLLAPGSDRLVIHLARNVLAIGSNIITGARHVTIEGGYDTCTTPTPSGRTLIDASGFAGSFLWFTTGYGGSDHVNVRLANLEIKNGTGNSAARGGAITISGPFWVTMLNTYIHDNSTSHDGGGIYVKGEAGVATGGDRTYLGLHHNNIIAGNTADNGGGLYLINASLYAFDATINSNTAVGRGGGVYAINSAVAMGRLRAGANCHEVLRCSQLSHNRVLSSTGSAGGGGIYALGGTTLISGTFIEDNSAATGNGLAVLVASAPGTGGGLDGNGLQIYGSVVARNGSSGPYSGSDASVVSIVDSSSKLGYNTFANNADVPRLVYTPTTGTVFYDGFNYGSIFANNSGVITDFGTQGGYPGGACNDVGTNTGQFAQDSTKSTPGGYVFVDAPSRDYRLASNSSDIDFCNIQMPAYVIDAGGGPRPYDDPGHLPIYGNHDLGALERHPDDLIFRNGVEP